MTDVNLRTNAADSSRLGTLRVAELQALALELGIPGSSKLRKGELVAAIVAVPIIGVVQWFIAALPFAYSLDYNEGIVWKQMTEIVAGRGYAPIDGFPAIVFHYPPVFHLAAAALAQTGLDPRVAGRVVSRASTAGSALLVGDLARRLLPNSPAGRAAVM